MHGVQVITREDLSVNHGSILWMTLINEDFVGALLEAARLYPAPATRSCSDAMGSSCFKKVREVDIDVLYGNKTIVGGILFVNGNHWTYLVLDFDKRSIGYGDSFAGPMPSEVMNTIVW